MVEYILEGQILELSDDTQLEFSISINDIRNPSSTNGTWSKTIQIPGTPNNNRILEFIYENNIVDGYNPLTKKSVEIRVDSIPTIQGYQKIEGIDIMGEEIIYNIVVFGNSLNIFDDMKDNLLSELDFSAYDHVYTKQNVANTWTMFSGNTRTYYYPFENHNDMKWSLKNIVDSGETYPFFPGFGVKALVDKIFETYSYSYDSNFFNTEVFKSLFLPYVNEPILIDKLVYFHTEFYMAAVDYVSHYNISAEYDPGSYFNTATYTFTYPIEGVFVIKMNGNYKTGTNYVDPEFSGVEIRLNGGVYDVYYVEDTSTDGSFKWEIELPSHPAGTTIKLTPFLFEPGGFADPDVMGLTISTYIAAKNKELILNFTNINAEMALPKGLKQRDFLTTLIKMFNLQWESNPEDNTIITIEPYNDYFSRSIDQDWTHKVDESSRKYKLMSELNCNSYKFTYKSDSDVGNKLYQDSLGQVLGEKIISINNDFITKEEKIELGCSPCVIESLSDADVQWPSSYKEGNTDPPTGYKGVITSNWNWRILSQSQIQVPIGYTWNGDTFSFFHSGDHVVIHKRPVYHTYNVFSLLFDAPNTGYTWDLSGTTLPTLYDLFWEDHIDLIKNQNSKLLTMDVYLSPYDISTLRFHNKIFVKDSWYILNKLTYSPTSKKGQAELLLIPQ